ncbi:imine reductase family protein [Actinomadura formosensis]|uniref:imine reductase family protein n=1 Tax=Actinomadura formosensis TaxID=60706 RepID=UPI003898DB66
MRLEVTGRCAREGYGYPCSGRPSTLPAQRATLLTRGGRPLQGTPQGHRQGTCRGHPDPWCLAVPGFSARNGGWGDGDVRERRGRPFDVALLDVFWTSMSGVVHGFALTAERGIAAKDLLALAKGLGTLLPGIMEVTAGNLDSGVHSGAGSTIALAAAGMGRVLRTARSRGLDAARSKRATGRGVFPAWPTSSGIPAATPVSAASGQQLAGWRRRRASRPDRREGPVAL